MRKRKKSLFERMTPGVAFVWFISGSAIDTESWIPFVVCALSTLWLGLYVHVQNVKQARREAAHG